jgi:hypothetical protein
VERTGHIEIRITGTKGNNPLVPANYDIREIRDVLEQAENLLYPFDKKDRPLIAYKMEEGSVKHIFKTSLQYIIGFNAVIGQVAQKQSLDFLDLPTAKALEAFQEMAVKKNYTFDIQTSEEESNTLHIDKSTRFVTNHALWIDAEFYFYGRITSLGGKERANIHVATEDRGVVIIQTSKDYLEQLEDNLLYKTYGIRAVGKQHSETGELDTTSLRFLELIDYNPIYEEEYLKKLRDKAKNNWQPGEDPDAWLRNLRGGYDA